MERRGVGVKAGGVMARLAQDMEALEGRLVRGGVAVGVFDVMEEGLMQVIDELVDGVAGAFDDEADATVGQVLDGACESGVALGKALGGVAEADPLDPAGEVDGFAGHRARIGRPRRGGLVYLLRL